MMSSIWSSVARPLNIIRGIDQEVENTIPVSSSSTAMVDRGGGGCDDSSGSFNAGWPSATPDSDWLPLETTWRMDSHPPADMMCSTYFHAGQTQARIRYKLIN